PAPEVVDTRPAAATAGGPPSTGVRFPLHSGKGTPVGPGAALVVVVGGGRRGRRLHRRRALAPHGGRGVGAGGQVGGLVDEGHHDAHGVGDGQGGVVDRL